MSACEKTRCWESALQLASSMILIRLELSGIGYSTAILACIRGGHWKKGLKLLKKMLNARVEPVVACYGAVLMGCEQHGVLCQEIAVCNNLMAMVADPDSQRRDLGPLAANAIVVRCIKEHKIEQALSQLREAACEGYWNGVS